ncbi:hypothetical protein QVD17_11338 [Tagetes erecta]|uniref:Uncharacterized protein n=1 Tax=Tagetes erecta TaxID=13708 RepID=A0AAD8NUU3_TARER|nr:hypothetical protein QVD17_11338 [Tagetes erecta]
MALNKLIYLLPFTLLFTLTISSDPATLSPAPPPLLGSDDSPPLPSPSPSTASPPSPPPASDLPPAPASLPSDLPKTPSISPAPETADAGDLSTNVKSEEPSNSSSGGMSAGKKAGIAIGVIAAACVIGFGGLLYKKRQQNIRRAEFSSAARTEFL